jgi:MHS family shikimate/dehydroshikimate transporter-like MFS transporter
MSLPVDPEKSKSISKAAIVSVSSALGWGFELFDFTSFMFAATYFAPLFFPSADPNTSILYAFVTSAIAFISRPIGGFVFGHYGDRLGRKSVWFTALLGMGLVSFALGCLPTYQQVGILATLLMVILRGLQGFFIAGEMAGGWTLTAEVSPAKWRAFFSGIVAMGSTMSGLFLSMAIFVANAFAPGAQLGIWGWRIIFWVGLLPLAIALIIRWKAAESVEWKLKAAPKVEKLPFLTAIRTDLKFFLVIFFAFAGQALFMYAGVSFMASFLRLYPKFPADQIATIVLITNIFSLAVAPLWGLISDVRKNRKWFIAIGFIINAVTLYPLVYIINLGQFWPAVVANVLICLFVPMAISALPIWIAENTRSTVRYSMTAVGTGFGAALGGLAPILIVQYSPSFGPVNAVSAVGMIGCIIAIIAVLFSPKDRAKQELK